MGPIIYITWDDLTKSKSTAEKLKTSPSQGGHKLSEWITPDRENIKIIRTGDPIGTIERNVIVLSDIH